MKRKRCDRTDCLYHNGKTRSRMLRGNGCGLLDTVEDECSFFTAAEVFKWNGKVKDELGCLNKYGCF